MTGWGYGLGRSVGLPLRLLVGILLLVVVAPVTAASSVPPHKQQHHTHVHNASPHQSSAHQQQSTQQQAQPHKSLLLIGNSFTEANDLWAVLEGLLVNASHDRDIHVEHYSPGGARLSMAVQNRQLRATIIDRPWTWVVLQEQSRIPAFMDTQWDKDFQASLNATQTLNSWIRESGRRHGVDTTTVLFLTWARRGPDWGWNPVLFPDFPTMQAMLTDGYRALQAAITTPQHPVPIAPVGWAFGEAYNRSVASEKNATARHTFFSDLYQPDQLHPSVPGTFLAATTIYATLTKLDPRIEYNWDDDVLNGPPVLLQEVAAQAVEDFLQTNAVNRQYYAMASASDASPLASGEGRIRFPLLLVFVVSAAAVLCWWGKKPPARTKATAADVELVDLLRVSHEEDDTHADDVSSSLPTTNTHGARRAQ
jgi:hypothetical protein